MSSPIPVFCRISFTVIDPSLAGFGVYANFFNPGAILSRFTPNPFSPLSPETTVLLYGITGFFAILTFLPVILLGARPNDVTVWRCMPAGVLFQDLFMIVGFLTEMNKVGRLDTNVWRPNDWANITIYPALMVVGPLLEARSWLKKARTSNFGEVTAEEPGSLSPLCTASHDP